MIERHTSGEQRKRTAGLSFAAPTDSRLLGSWRRGTKSLDLLFASRNLVGFVQPFGDGQHQLVNHQKIRVIRKLLEHLLVMSVGLGIRTIKASLFSGLEQEPKLLLRTWTALKGRLVRVNCIAHTSLGPVKISQLFRKDSALACRGN